MKDQLTQTNKTTDSIIESEIEILQVFKFLWKYKLIILFITLLGISWSSYIFLKTPASWQETVYLGPTDILDHANYIKSKNIVFNENSNSWESLYLFDQFNSFLNFHQKKERPSVKNIRSNYHMVSGSYYVRQLASSIQIDFQSQSRSSLPEIISNFLEQMNQDFFNERMSFLTNNQQLRLQELNQRIDLYKKNKGNSPTLIDLEVTKLLINNLPLDFSNHHAYRQIGESQTREVARSRQLFIIIVTGIASFVLGCILALAKDHFFKTDQ